MKTSDLKLIATYRIDGLAIGAEMSIRQAPDGSYRTDGRNDVYPDLEAAKKVITEMFINLVIHDARMEALIKQLDKEREARIAAHYPPPFLTGALIEDEPRDMEAYYLFHELRESGR